MERRRTMMRLDSESNRDRKPINFSQNEQYLDAIIQSSDDDSEAPLNDRDAI